MTHEVATLQPTRTSLVERIAQRYEVEPEKLIRTLKSTCFRQAPDKPEITNEQMMGLLIVAEQYKLNPFTRELFAFDDKRGGIIPYVSVDGWSRIVNEHPQFDGMSFLWDETQQSITCTIWRKDRSHPTIVTEYLVECRRQTTPWQTAPRRMLRHKALMQCARLAFGFAGIFDEDEAQRIVENGHTVQPLAERPASTQRAALARVLQASQEHFAQPVTDVIPDGSDVVTVGMEMLAGELEACDSPDEAANVLERAASILGPDELARLNERAAARFNEENP